MVSVYLHDLYEPKDMTLDLFDQGPTAPNNQNLSRAIDALNARYGKQTVTIGPIPQTSAGYMGTKIAFNRQTPLPEREDDLRSAGPDGTRFPTQHGLKTSCWPINRGYNRVGD